MVTDGHELEMVSCFLQLFLFFLIIIPKLQLYHVNKLVHKWDRVGQTVYNVYKTDKISESFGRT